MKNKQEYAEYRNDPRWRALSEARKEIDGYRCAYCGSRENLQVHHLSYVSMNAEPYSESVEHDLVTVCDKCHHELHPEKEDCEKQSDGVVWGITPLSEMEETPVEWLVEGILPRLGTVGLIAPKASGKSWLVLDRAMSIACGLNDWHGKTIHSYGNQDVIYFCGEGAPNIRSRLDIWREYHNKSIANAHISVSSLRENLTAKTRPYIEKEIENLGLKPCLMIFDTLNCYFDGDENATQDMSLFTHEMRALSQKYQCCVEVVHHTGHSAESQNRERGNSAFSGNLDVITVLSSQVRKDGYVYIAAQTKNKYTAAGENNIALDVKEITSKLYRRQNGKFETALIPVGAIPHAQTHQNTNQNAPSSEQRLLLQRLIDVCKRTKCSYNAIPWEEIKKEVGKHKHYSRYEQDLEKTLDSLETGGFVAYSESNKDEIILLHSPTIIAICNLCAK